VHGRWQVDPCTPGKKAMCDLYAELGGSVMLYDGCVAHRAFCAPKVQILRRFRSGPGICGAFLYVVRRAEWETALTAQIRKEGAVSECRPSVGGHVAKVSPCLVSMRQLLSRNAPVPKRLVRIVRAVTEWARDLRPRHSQDVCHGRDFHWADEPPAADKARVLCNVVIYRSGRFVMCRRPTH